MPVTNVKAGETDQTRESVLDVVDRVSEMCFGLFMALTFVGAVHTATPGTDPGRTLLHAALGCNLAWGLVDAIMYLVRTLADRGRRLTVAMAAKRAPSAAQAVRDIRAALPSAVQQLLGDPEIELMRQRLVSAANLPARPRLDIRDVLASIRIFFIVVLSTFPVALPFVLLTDVTQALFVSRVLTVIMLFAGGMALGRYAGYSGWATGLGMMALGVALTMAVIALGG